MCAAGGTCPEAAAPWIDVVMNGPRRGEVEWSPAVAEGAVVLVRSELKTSPAK